MKIAMISEHASPLVAELSAALGRQGHYVTLYTRRDSPAQRDRVRLAPGVTVEHVPAGPPEHIARQDLLPWTHDFARHLERRWAADPPDVAHAHFWMSGLAAIQAAQAAGARRVPVVQTFHDLGIVSRRHQGGDTGPFRGARGVVPPHEAGPASRVRLERAIGHAVDAVIATCSEEVAELAAMGVPHDRVRVVPCGVDLGLFAPGGSADDRRRLVVVSRLVEHRGVDTAIRALAKVPNAELAIAGGPRGDLDADPDVRRLREVARDAGVAGRVTFLGRLDREEVPPLLRSAGLVVALPWYEQFGMVPVEAMACGVPVVASAVGGHLDTVVDGVTGVHVAPLDPDGAAAAIRALLDDPARRAAMGAAGGDRARDRHSWSRVATDIASVYRHAAALTEVAA